MTLEKVMKAMLSALENSSSNSSQVTVEWRSTEFEQLRYFSFNEVKEFTHRVEKLAHKHDLKLARSFRNFQNSEKGFSRGFYYCSGRRETCPFKIRFTWKKNVQRFEVVELNTRHQHQENENSTSSPVKRKYVMISDEMSMMQRYDEVKVLCEQVTRRSMEDSSFFRRSTKALRALLDDDDEEMRNLILNEIN